MEASEALDKSPPHADENNVNMSHHKIRRLVMPVSAPSACDAALSAEIQLGQIKLMASNTKHETHPSSKVHCP